jgi:hypothetical protein
MAISLSERTVLFLKGYQKNPVHISHRAASVESSIFPERVTGLRQHTDEDRAERAPVVKRISGPN